MAEQLAQRLRLEPEQVDPQIPLSTLGLNPMDALSLGNELGQWLGTPQPPGLLHQFPTLEALVDHLAPVAPEPAQPKSAPLSSVQERMWFLHQLQDPEQHSIHFFDSYRITGELNVARLAQALDQVVQNNEALRTGFALQDGGPVQVVQPKAPVALTEEDLRGLTTAEREQAVHEATVAQSRRPFDLTGGAPPVRFRLLRLAASERLLMITVHHICTDAPSWGQLIKELGQRYNALGAGKQPQQREVPTFSDYVDWQRGWLESDAAAEQLAHWREALAGSAEALDLPLDHARPAALAVKPAATQIELPSELIEAVKALATEQGVTPFVVLLAAFDLLMAQLSGQDDILVASPILSRGEARFLRTQGSFADVVVLREQLVGDPTFAELLPRVRQTVDEAFKHQDLPFSDVVAACREGAPAQDRTPLAQVLFNPAEAGLVPRLRGCEVELASQTWLSRDTYVGLGSLGFDLALWVVKRGGKQLCICAFNPDLYEPGSVDRLLDQYRTLLEGAVRAPDARSSELVANVPPGWRTLAVASTFTAEPLEETLTFWMEKLGLQAKIRFAAYNQVFQELLDPSSLLRGNTHGANLVLLRLEDWLRYEGERAAGDAAQKLRRNVDDLIEALRSAAGQLPCVVARCPPSPAAGAEHGDLLSELDARLTQGLTSVSGVHLISADEVAQRYPVAQVHNPAGDAQGHIPHTPEYFTALATLAARKVAALERAPYKVIALDCDNTLWRGVCGEDGPDGVAFDGGHRALQTFMIRQLEQGMVLCLSSKNVEQDVDAVFERRADEMLLKAEHVVTRRINWQPKSQGLREMAEELNLGLDSFIFVDDNEVECAEVSASLPGVLTVHLPPPEEIEAFLSHHWAFDRQGVTAEDKKRAAMYRQNVEREQARSAATSFSDFLAGLDLKVELAELTPETLPRVSQLTQRTNQFNATTVRRTEAEVEGLAAQGLECLTMRVADRFGDYGLVGVVIYDAGDAALKVDSFMLSCRVLGRGVEHRMVARLGEIAVERGLEQVVIPYVETAKNQPLLDFLQAVAGEHRIEREGGALFELSASVAAAVKIDPGRADGAPLPKKKSTKTATTSPAGAAEPLAEIARELRSVAQIQAAVQARFRKARDAGEAGYVAPRGETERALAAIWQQVLNVDQVGVQDDFFTLGGDSLLAVQVLTRAATEGLELRTEHLFRHHTIAALAAALEGTAPDGDASSLDLRDELQLAPEIHPADGEVAPPGEPRHVLLTGATGFVGAHLLLELLQGTQAEITCLVRGADDDEAHRRLLRVMARYGLQHEGLQRRLRVLQGDLAAPRLGLTEAAFDALGRELDLIFHNGALVSFIQPYAALRAANVEATREILRLACLHRTKPVHHVSTINVFSAEQSAGRLLLEDEPLTEPSGLEDGYAQSKWVAEQLVALAGERGVPTTIYRLGGITGHSVSGRTNPGDFFNAVVLGMAQLGLAPDVDAEFGFIPVDYAAQALVALSRRADAAGRAYHLIPANKIPPTRFIEWLGAFGQQVRLIPFAQWRKALREQVGRVDNPLHPYLPLFEGDDEAFYGAAPLRLDDRNVRQALAEAGLSCPRTDRALFGKYLRAAAREAGVRWTWLTDVALAARQHPWAAALLVAAALALPAVVVAWCW